MVCMLGTLRWELEETAAAGSLPQIWTKGVCAEAVIPFFPQMLNDPLKKHIKCWKKQQLL